MTGLQERLLLESNSSFEGLQMTSNYGSGLAPATWEYQQAQQPLSVAVKNMVVVAPSVPLDLCSLFRL